MENCGLGSESMSKAGNFLTFVSMGWLIEILLLLLLKPNYTQIQFVQIIALISLLFLAFRFLMDWRYFSNSIQKDLLHIQIDSSPIIKLSFSVLTAIILVFSNWIFLQQISFYKLFFFGFVSSFCGWYFFDLVRSIEFSGLKNLFCLPTLNKNEVVKGVTYDGL